MAHSKRQTWEAAKAANLDTFITKVSAAFGSEAIAEVAITSGGLVTATSDDMLREPERISLSAQVNPAREIVARQWKERISIMRNNPLVTPP